MTADPWDAFRAAARDASVAGYFERGEGFAAGGGRAAWFDDASDVWRLPARTTPRALEAETRSRLAGHPRGALVGYVGFDAVGLFEPLLRDAPDGAPFPRGEFAVVRRLRTARVERRSSPQSGLPSHPAQRVPAPRTDSLPEGRYRASVERLRRAIYAGEAFQVVLSHRRSWDRPADLLERAGWLRSRERYAYFYYLRFDDREIVGASPESVVEVRGRRATVSPIAGTRPADTAGTIRRSLADDPKELAEHRMLVDLARNDLGRVCVPGKVRVVERERLERFARLEHLISRVEGRLAPGIGPWSALAATFPAGTVAGAPKIRATRLLRREERSWRGPYAGAVGLVSAPGDADWALAIRTAFAARDTLHTAAGAGIVWPSRPQREYRETLAKLAELEASLLGEVNRGS